MTQEEKQLLLKDLCARLPYNVVIHYHWESKAINKTIDVDRELDFSDVETLKYNLTNPQDNWCIIDWKPYLRPMSSMTKEEVIEYLSVCDKDYKDSLTTPRHSGVDWLNSHHFDYRGLIEKGLALEALEDMYK